MKNLPLQNPTHQRIEKAFQEWLKVMGYAPNTIYSLPLHVREFFHWLEQKCDLSRPFEKTLENVVPSDIELYFFHLKTRTCTRKTGAMSVNNLHKHRQALKRLSYYLKETGQAFLEIDITLPKQQRKLKEILTKAEIQQLYDRCDRTPLGIRDSAMLALFYGCGLRRTEGVGLDVSDILFDQKMIYVRKGKHYKERYVPMTQEVKNELENYLNYGRPVLLKDPNQPSFFVSERGTRPQGQSLYLRLKKLAQKMELGREIGLHDLRHSIATHLLQSGMKLTHIAKFLGHDSMESTQIYTHIMNETEENE